MTSQKQSFITPMKSYYLPESCFWVSRLSDELIFWWCENLTKKQKTNIQKSIRTNSPKQLE